MWFVCHDWWPVMIIDARPDWDTTCPICGRPASACRRVRADPLPGTKELHVLDLV